MVSVTRVKSFRARKRDGSSRKQGCFGLTPDGFTDGSGPFAVRARPCEVKKRKRRSPIGVREAQLAFHPRERRNAFRRRDARLQQRSFACKDPLLRCSPAVPLPY